MSDELTSGEKKILLRLEKGPIELYWGRNGWCPSSYPAGTKRADFDVLMRRDIVKVMLGRLVKA